MEVNVILVEKIVQVLLFVVKELLFLLLAGRVEREPVPMQRLAVPVEARVFMVDREHQVKEIVRLISFVAKQILLLLLLLLQAMLLFMTGNAQRILNSIPLRICVGQIAR
jgi:hypothetical protein